MQKRKWHRTVVLAAVVLTVLAGIWYLWIYDGIRYDYAVMKADTDQFSWLELKEGQEIRQRFRSGKRYLKGVELLLINLAEDGQGSIRIVLSDDTGAPAASALKQLSEIAPGEWAFFPLQVRLDRNRTYELAVSAEGCTSVPYVLTAVGENNPEENLQCYDGGKPLEEGTGLLAGYGYALTASTWEKFLISVLLLLFAAAFAGFEIAGGGKTETGWREKVRHVLAAGLFLIQFLLMVPDIVYRLDNISLDPSWRYFLNLALPENIKFGRDVFFTYGPLGYLCYLMKLPENLFYYRIGVALWILIILIQGYLFWRLYQLYLSGKLSFSAIVFSVICYVAAHSEVTRDNYLLYTMILAVTAYSLGARYVRAIPNFLLILMFFGKFSTFTSGLAFLILFVCFDLLFSRRKSSLLLCLPGLVVMPCLYLLYCPSLKSLFDYVTGIFYISDGWMMSQQWNQVLEEGEIRKLAAIMIFYVLLLGLSLWLNYRRSEVILACSASMFLVYKYATTRHGLEVGIWLFGMLFSAVLLSLDWSLLREKCRERPGRMLPVCLLWLTAVCGTGIVQANALHWNFGYVRERFADKVYTLTHLEEDSVLARTKEENRLPDRILETVGEHTVTVYPWRNGYRAVHEELNMVWYPSVQNVNEFIPWLDEKVADWFLSDRAADYILLSDETIDDHIKYLDNPLTWEAIRSRYRVVMTEGDVCLLEKCGAGEKPRLELLFSEKYALTDSVICPPEADYARVFLSLSGKGKLKKFFWHVGVTELRIVYEDGSGVQGRAIVPNLVSGFALTKVPQNLTELEDVLAGRDTARITEFSFLGKGLLDMTEQFTVEWYRYAAN